MTDRSTPPDEETVREWMGPGAFRHWRSMQEWIDASYPGAFVPEWLYGGQKHGWSLRYKKSRAFCTLVPEYGQFSVVIVLGAAERATFGAGRAVLGARLAALYDEAETYADGKWLKVGVASEAELREVTDLLAIKRPRRMHPSRVARTA